jgi:type I restriction enzyme S subunit
MRKTICLGDMATYINGYAFKPVDWGTKGLPIIRIQNLTDSGKDYNYYDGEIKEKYLVKKGDVLISWSASIGVFEWEKEDAWLNQHIFKVVFDKKEVNKQYFKYVTSYVLKKSLQYAHGSTMKHLTKSTFDKLPIPIYDLNVQRVIAEKIGKVDEAIAECDAMLADFDLLVKSRFVEMFGEPNKMDRWQCCKVKDVADVTVGLVIKPTRFYTDDADNGIKAFRSLNVREMRVNDSDWVYFSKEGNEQNKKSQLKKGDVLIVRSGYPGTSCVVTDEYVGCNAIDIIIARPNQEKVNPYYLCAFNNFPHGMNQIQHGTGGAAQKHFNVGAYNDMVIAVPPMKLQNDFVEFMEQADKSKLIIQKSLDGLQELRDSLLQEYFG